MRAWKVAGGGGQGMHVVQSRGMQELSESFGKKWGPEQANEEMS